MRLAVFSDVHSNSIAFETCINYAEHVGVDGYVFLGDLLSDCPHPRRTLELVRAAARKKPTWYARGNREEYLIRHHDHGANDWKPQGLTGSLLYTYEHITLQDIEMIKRMPLTDVVVIPGCPSIRIAHASPTDMDAQLFPGTESLERILKSVKESVFLTGHSHFQYRYESRGKQVVNPGSVGMPSYGQTKAQFALLTCETDRWTARLMNVDYDKEREIEQFQESGLMDMAPTWSKCSIKTIRQGGNWHNDCLALAKKMTPTGREVAEITLADAAKQLGIQ